MSRIEKFDEDVTYLTELWARLLPGIAPSRGQQQFAMWLLQSRGDLEMVTDAFEATAKKNAALGFTMDEDFAGRFTTSAINRRKERVTETKGAAQ